MSIRWVHAEYKWFLLAGVLAALFLMFTAVFATGQLLQWTLQMEQLLLHRPLTRVDCVFRQWKRFGEVPFSLFFTLLLGGICLWLGYRRRVLPYLFLLVLLCVGIEVVGKQVFSQPVPDTLHFGINALACPQMAHKPHSVELMVTLGMWWAAPRVSARRIHNEQTSAITPFSLEDASDNYGYPSGHAIRWMFLGLIGGWLIWRHVRYRLLRAILLGMALAVAFGGGFTLFYMGSHLITDMIAGYLVGASAACCAIGLLLHNEKRKEKGQLGELVPADGSGVLVNER